MDKSQMAGLNYDLPEIFPLPKRKKIAKTKDQLVDLYFCKKPTLTKKRYNALIKYVYSIPLIFFSA